MALNFDWGLFQQAADRKRQAQQQDMEAIQGIGQTLEATSRQFAERAQEQRKRDLVQKLAMSMQNQGAPQQGPQMATGPAIQGPNGYVPPGSSTGVPAGRFPMPGNPTSGIGAPPQDNTKQMQSLMMQLDPQGMIKQMMDQQDPYKKALTNQANAEAQAKLRPPKPPLEYTDSGESPSGTRLILNKADGSIKDTGVKVGSKKSDAGDFKNALRQDRLEKEYSDRVSKVVNSRTGQLGMQDAKVNQAVHVRSLANQYYNPATKTFDIPEAQAGEMVMGLANLVSGSNVATIEALRSITPKTASSDVQHMVAYWSGKPVTYNTQAMYKNLLDSIDRQGSVSEKLRSKYISGLRSLRPKGLDPETADNIEKTNFTTSYDEFLKEAPDKSSGMAGGLTPQELEEFKKLDAKFGGKK